MTAPVRDAQWVFTVLKPLRLVLARDPAWASFVANTCVRAIGAWQHRVRAGAWSADTARAAARGRPNAAERDDDLVAARLASHPREAVREDAASQVRRELALELTRQPAAVGISVAQLGEHAGRLSTAHA